MAVRFKEFLLFKKRERESSVLKTLSPQKIHGKNNIFYIKKNPYNSSSSNCPSVYATHGQKSPPLWGSISSIYFRSNCHKLYNTTAERWAPSLSSARQEQSDYPGNQRSHDQHLLFWLDATD